MPKSTIVAPRARGSSRLIRVETDIKPRPCLQCGDSHQSAKGYCQHCVRFLGLSDEALNARIRWFLDELQMAQTERARRKNAKANYVTQEFLQKTVTSPF